MGSVCVYEEALVFIIVFILVVWVLSVCNYSVFYEEALVLTQAVAHSLRESYMANPVHLSPSRNTAKNLRGGLREGHRNTLTQQRI